MPVVVREPVERLLRAYARGIDAIPQGVINAHTLERRVSRTLRGRAVSVSRRLELLRLALAVAAAAASGLAVTAAYQLERHRSDAPTGTTAIPVGDWLSTTRGTVDQQDFADGTSVRLEGESSARVQFVNGAGGLVHLVQGGVSLEGHRVGGTTWRVFAGPYVVESAAANYAIYWTLLPIKRLRLRVRAGTANVWSSRLRERRVLVAPQELEVDDARDVR